MKTALDGVHKRTIPLCDPVRHTMEKGRPHR